MKIDIHTHSTFSHDGQSSLEKMVKAAKEKGIKYYGISEHFDFDYCEEEKLKCRPINKQQYFVTCRELTVPFRGRCIKIDI